MNEPLTTPPTDTEWANHCRWAIGPIGTRRQMWVEQEAQERFTRESGRSDPVYMQKNAAHYFAIANSVIPN